MFKIRVRVANPADASRFFEDDFWVDTGPLYSFAPEDRLEAIGIDPSLSREVILPDCPVIFGPPASLHLLGATALETFGVDADPIGKRLKPVAAVIGGFLASK